MRLATFGLILSVASIVAVPSAFGQQERPRGERQRQGEQRFNPEQMRERRAEMIKERLGVDAEEWSVLQPRLDRVMEAQRQTSVGGFGGRGGRGGNRGGPDAQQAAQDTSALAQAGQELRTALEAQDTAADEIRTRLEAYRAARTKANGDLQAARAELSELLTQRQEAQLVMMGVLE